MLGVTSTCVRKCLELWLCVTSTCVRKCLVLPARKCLVLWLCVTSTCVRKCLVLPACVYVSAWCYGCVLPARVYVGAWCYCASLGRSTFHLHRTPPTDPHTCIGSPAPPLHCSYTATLSYHTLSYHALSCHDTATPLRVHSHELGNLTL